MFNGIGLLKPLKSANVATMARSLLLLLRDEFTTAEAAPMVSPRTCEPGPGTITVNNLCSIASNRLTVALNQQAGANVGIPRAAGLCCTFERVSGSTTAAGFSGSANWSTGADGLLNFASNPRLANSSGTIMAPSVLAVPYFVVARAAGAFYLRYESPNYVLMHVDTVQTYGTMYAGFRNFAAGIVIEYLRVANLADYSTIWGTTYDLATERIASPIAGNTITMVADSLVEHTWPVVTGETLEFDVRRTDADNRWVVRCSQSGSTIKLIERNAGVETERSSAAQTWTNGVSYRITVNCNGNNIYLGVAGLDKGSYTSATFNNSATGVKVDGFAGTGSNLISWARLLTNVSAIAALEAIRLL